VLAERAGYEAFKQGRKCLGRVQNGCRGVVCVSRRIYVSIPGKGLGAALVLLIARAGQQGLLEIETRRSAASSGNSSLA
jgi:hypothetical protein